MTQVYDDIDDYEEANCFPITAGEDTVSKFCIAIYDSTNNVAIGSGILLNSDGMFISAGHNFKKQNSKFKAYINGEIYDISLLYYEYDSEELLDFAVGKLLNFNTQDYINENFPTLRDCSNLGIGSKINVAGFKSFKVRHAEVLEEINPMDGIYLFKQRKEFSIVEPDKSQNIISEQLNGRGIFYMPTAKANYYKGFSGGPAYIDDKIYGIVLSHYFLTSEYIKETLEKELGHNLYPTDK